MGGWGLRGLGMEWMSGELDGGKRRWWGLCGMEFGMCCVMVKKWGWILLLGEEKSGILMCLCCMIMMFYVLFIGVLWIIY